MYKVTMHILRTSHTALYQALKKRLSLC